MRYLLHCCSDTHGRIPPAPRLDDCVAWLHAGDLCDGAEARDVNPEADPLIDPILAPVTKWFCDRTAPVFFVQGNHDVVDLYHASRFAKDVTGLLVPIAQGLCIAGIGWHGERYFELPFEADLRSCCESLLRMARRLLMPQDRVVLLTHYPPRFPGTHDVPNDRDGAGVWYDCVRDLAQELRASVVIQGHNHQWFGEVHRLNLAYGQLLIVNPGPAGCSVAIDTQTGNAETSTLSVSRAKGSRK